MRVGRGVHDLLFRSSTFLLHHVLLTIILTTSSPTSHGAWCLVPGRGSKA